MDEIPLNESSLILDIIVYLGSSLLTLTKVILGAIHPNLYLISNDKVSN